MVFPSQHALRRFRKSVSRALLLGSLALICGAHWAPGGVALAKAPPTPKQSVASEIPPGFESYLSRPDILKVQPKSHPELGEAWNKLVRAHLEAVALLLEMYPEDEIYFLARDSEYLYDLARSLSRDQPALLKRLHLLNVSRANMRADHVREYLAQEGISAATLKKNARILLIDTGFSGTIPKVIQELFPADLRARIRTHLICSANSAYPSMRVFLGALNPAVNETYPGSMHGSIISYEHMARHTDRSDRFFQTSDRRWHPLSPAEGGVDGDVSPTKAQAYREDLLFEARTGEFKTLFRTRSEHWRDLYKLTHAGAEFAEITDHLKKRLKEAPSDPFVESMVRDYLDMLRTRTVASMKGETLKPADVGLHAATGEGEGSNKNDLIHKYPEWASILEEPESNIKKLVKAGDFGKLGAIMDVLDDHEFTGLLCKALGTHADLPGTRAFIEMLVNKSDPTISTHLSIQTFSHPHTAGMKDLIAVLIQQGNQEVLQYLAQYTFAAPHTQTMTDLIRLLIEKTQDIYLSSVATGIFTKAHSKNMEDLLELVIEKGNPNTRVTIAGEVFSRPHARHMVKALKRLIETEDQNVFSALAYRAFSKAHPRTWTPFLETLVEKGDEHVLGVLAHSVFPRPDTAGKAYVPLLKRMIERAEGATLYKLASNTFSEPHTQGMTDLLRLFIEKADPDGLSALASFTFASPHTASMRELIRLTIERGDAKVMHSFAAFVFSKPHTVGMHEEMKLALEKSDRLGLGLFAKNVFSLPHMEGQGDLLRLLVEKAEDPRTVELLMSNVFNQKHWQTPEGEILKESLNYGDREKRGAFLDARLGRSSLSGLLGPSAEACKALMGNAPLPSHPDGP